MGTSKERREAACDRRHHLSCFPTLAIEVRGMILFFLPTNNDPLHGSSEVPVTNPLAILRQWSPVSATLGKEVDKFPHEVRRMPSHIPANNFFLKFLLKMVAKGVVIPLQ